MSHTCLKGGRWSRLREERPAGRHGSSLRGHGELRYGSGTVTVPEGTTLTTWGAHGTKLPDSVGLAVESGSYGFHRRT